MVVGWVGARRLDYKDLARSYHILIEMGFSSSGSAGKVSVEFLKSDFHPSKAF